MTEDEHCPDRKFTTAIGARQYINARHGKHSKTPIMTGKSFDKAVQAFTAKGKI